MAKIFQPSDKIKLIFILFYRGSCWRAIRVKEVALWRLTSLSRWSKAKFKSPCNFEESPYVTARVFSPLAIYENVDIVHVFIEIYRIHYYPLVR
jgi:hypothetical protein